MTTNKRTVTVHDCRCERCGHTWTTKTDKLPGTCPKCKSIYWDRPRQPRPRRKEGEK